jgi:hypothetical protein
MRIPVRVLLAALFCLGLWAVSSTLHAQTITVQTVESTAGSDHIIGGPKTSVDADLMQAIVLNGVQFPAGSTISVTWRKDETGTQAFYINFVFVGKSASMFKATSAPAVLLDRSNTPLTKEAQQEAFQKMMKRGEVVLPKGTLLSFSNVAVVVPHPATSASAVAPAAQRPAPQAPTSPMQNIDAMTAAAMKVPATGPPRTTPLNPHDPTGFNIMGVKLYMSAQEAVAALEQKVGFSLPACKQTPTPRCVSFDSKVGAVSFTAPGKGNSAREVAPAFVRDLTYAADSYTLRIEFSGETPSRMFGKPEIATIISYAVHAQTAADVNAFFAAAESKYGPPLITKQSIDIVMGNRISGQIELWSAGTGNDSFIRFPTGGFPYPILQILGGAPQPSNGTTDYPCLLSFRPDMQPDGTLPGTAALTVGLVLRASPRFDDLRNREIKAAEQKMIEDANKKTTISTQF